MKKNKYEQELKHLKELREICLDILEELQNAHTYFGIRKKERYERKVKYLDEKIKRLSNV